MELYASAALAGTGSLLQKQRDLLKKSIAGAAAAPVAYSQVATPAPSMNNMYSSDYWRTAKQEEARRGAAMTQASRSPLETGVVARPAYASQFAAPMTESLSLTGQPIDPNNFKHNNMQPFYKGRAKQNIDPSANGALLERFTGQGELLMHKKENECFFEPTKGNANICGMKNNDDFYISRIEAPKVRNNDFPIAQIRVGPGMDAGFTASPDGGFQQTKTLDVIRPKTVDELRALSRPKVSYETGPQGPMKAGVTNRGHVAVPSKNLPETFYEQTPDMWLRTGGAVKKDTERPVYDVKPTARVDGNVEYKGAAARPDVTPATYDYGKAAVMVYDNERMTTETRTVITNVTSMVKAVIAPLLDVMRLTPKQYTEEAARTFGNMHAQIPSKPTTYDPVNHMMRTTIKETTVHDTTVMAPRGPDAVPVHADDEARQTIRETLPLEDTTRNVSAHTYKVIAYDPDAVARTTLRETTTGAANPVGYVGGDATRSKGAYTHIPVKVGLTQKQFTAIQHTGSAGAKAEFTPRTRDAEYNAEIDGTREALNIASAIVPPAGGALGTIGTDAAQINVASNKPAHDVFNARTNGNVSRVYQDTARAIDPCETTRLPVSAVNDQSYRLDPTLMNALRTNEYILPVNPIGA